MKRLFDEFKRAKDVLGKAKNQIHEGFEELREDQDALAAKNGVTDVNRSEILDINAGRGHHVRNQIHPDSDQGDEAGGSVQQTVGQEPSKGQGRQGVPGCKS